MKKSKNKNTQKQARQPQNKPAPAQPASFHYAPPVDRLLALGDCRASMSKWPDYKALGLVGEHIPELIRMATDEALDEVASESSEVWAPIHAWRALGQLRATEAIPTLLGLLPSGEDSDWVGEELPDVFALIGAPALEPLTAYLLDPSNEVWARITASGCLEHIALRHREARAACVSALTRALEAFERNDEELNGFLVHSLCEIEADEALPLMERAFKSGKVDEFIMGDWDDIRAEFGLPPERIDEQALKDAAQGLKSQPTQRPFFSRYLSRDPQTKPRKN